MGENFDDFMRLYNMNCFDIFSIDDFKLLILVFFYI